MTAKRRSTARKSTTAKQEPERNTRAAEEIKRAKKHELYPGFYWFEGMVRGDEVIAPVEYREDGLLYLFGKARGAPKTKVAGSFYPFDSTADLIAIW